jgi:hypothetical protein
MMTITCWILRMPEAVAGVLLGLAAGREGAEGLPVIMQPDRSTRVRPSATVHRQRALLGIMLIRPAISHVIHGF